MVNFGKKLLECQYGPWSVHYLDYGLLKGILEEYSHDRAEDKSAASRRSSSNIHTGTTTSDEAFESVLVARAHRKTKQNPTTSNFLSELYIQTEKVSFFVMQELGRISFELSECRQVLRQRSIDQTDESELLSLEEKYKDAALHLLRLIHFIDLNMTGFRKILKKYDKVFRTKLSLSYLAVNPRHSALGSSSWGLLSRATTPTAYNSIGHNLNTVALGNQLLQPLLQDDSVAAVTAALQGGIEELRYHWQRYLDKSDKHSRSSTAPDLEALVSNVKPYQQINNSYYRSHSDMQSMMLEKQQPCNERLIRPDQVLLQIHAARSRLQQTNDFIKLLAAPAMLVPALEGEDEDESSSARKTHRPSKLSNFLNLLSTFFYMTNYYIVAPTSATYADRLGTDSSMASIIIGMTAVAALVSTFLYSWWTSYSYKSALIFASTCSVIGNLVYAAGLPCKSLTLVMLGRLLNGFGSARSINRRYIADSYPRADRTAASAAFVTATALGMATGPALAAVLHIATKGSSSVYWQAENAPGVFMFFVWIFFLVCLIWKFEEPPRYESSGLTASQNENQNGTPDEKKSLLFGDATKGDEKKEDSASLWCNIPVIVTLIVYMVLKMTLEAVLSSESNLTALYFDWEGDIMGLHLMLLALLILPVNFGVTFLARSYNDRELIAGLLAAMIVGCLVILQYQKNSEDYTMVQYLTGSAVLFVCASALEGPNMALLSKVIPRKWSKGLVNVGLLATESGTGGRVVGDMVLAYVGSEHGIENLLNRAFGAFAGIILGTLVTTLAFFKHLEPIDEGE